MKIPKNQRPPRIADRLFKWYAKNAAVEDLLGDVKEIFYANLRVMPTRKAKILYWRQILSLVFSYAVKSRIRNSAHPPDTSPGISMIRNYLLMGWRNLIKQKMYSVIKIGGFAVGIGACILIALFIREEVGYDRHYKNGDRIYRVWRQGKFRDQVGKSADFPPPFAKALIEDYPDVEKAGRYIPVRSFGQGMNEVRRIDRTENTDEAAMAYVDQDLADILELQYVAGSSSTAFARPFSIVITEKTAEKYFKSESPLGKVFILNNDEHQQYTVTGVIRDFPLTSHFHYDFLMTLAGKEFWPGEQTAWRNSNYPTYVRLREGTNTQEFEKKLRSSIAKYFLASAIQDGENKEVIDWLKSMSIHLQPVHEVYLNKEGLFDDLKHGEITYIWLFGGIATFILLIACVNFINLSTARSAGRAKEVGLRKVVGSTRSGLIHQFMCESLIFSYLSVAIGVLLAWMLLPYFNNILDRSFIFPWTEWKLIPILLAAATFIGLAAGFYPSFYLSSFRPAQVLKGNVSLGARNPTMRNVLVVFQFSVSIFLIIATVIVQRQMSYILDKKLGFDRNQVIILEGTHLLGTKMPAFKEKLLGLADVKYVTVSSFIPVDGSNRDGGPMWIAGTADIDKITTQFWDVDRDYVKTMGLRITAGRDFVQDARSDSQSIIINHALADALHLKDPVGQQVFNWRGGWTVIGVVEDFHFQSLKQPILPMGMVLRKSENMVSVKVRTSDMASTVVAINKIWKEFSPNQVMRFNFLDEQYAHMYDDVSRMGSIFTSFAVLAIVIACLGLFALSAYVAEQRSKEISIRLVLGASANGIFRLLTGNFLVLVFISLIIATPLGLYFMTEWLKDFAYKTEMGWDVFALAGVVSLSIALLTISYQSVKSAHLNPIANLRGE